MLDFVESPGASEQTFPFKDNFESDNLSSDIDEGHFFVGGLVNDQHLKNLRLHLPIVQTTQSV